MEELIEIGKIIKAHGLDGGVKCAIEDEYLEDFLSVGVLFLIEKGQPVPYFVEGIKGVQLVLELDGVDNKELATGLANKKIYIRKSDLIPEEEKTFIPEGLEYDFVIGYEILDENIGNLGVIDEVIEYPQQEMASLQYKGKGILIPLNNNFIQSIDEDNKQLLMNLPEGMIDVQL